MGCRLWEVVDYERWSHMKVYCFLTKDYCQSNDILWWRNNTLFFFFNKNIVFPARAEYSYFSDFSADVRQKIFLWIFIDYSVWHFRFTIECIGVSITGLNGKLSPPPPPQKKKKFRGCRIAHVDPQPWRCSKSRDDYFEVKWEFPEIRLRGAALDTTTPASSYWRWHLTITACLA